MVESNVDNGEKLLKELIEKKNKENPKYGNNKGSDLYQECVKRLKEGKDESAKSRLVTNAFILNDIKKAKDELEKIDGVLFLQGQNKYYITQDLVVYRVTQIKEVTKLNLKGEKFIERNIQSLEELIGETKTTILKAAQNHLLQAQKTLINDQYVKDIRDIIRNLGIDDSNIQTECVNLILTQDLKNFKDLQAPQKQEFIANAIKENASAKLQGIDGKTPIQNNLGNISKDIQIYQKYITDSNELQQYDIKKIANDYCSDVKQAAYVISKTYQNNEDIQSFKGISDGLSGKLLEAKKSLVTAKLTTFVVKEKVDEIINKITEEQKPDILIDETGDKAKINDIVFNQKFDEYAKKTLQDKIKNLLEPNDKAPTEQIVANLGFNKIENNNNRKNLSDSCWDDDNNEKLKNLSFNKINGLLTGKLGQADDETKEAISKLQEDIEATTDNQYQQPDQYLPLLTEGGLNNAINGKKQQLQQQKENEKKNAISNTIKLFTQNEVRQDPSNPNNLNNINDLFANFDKKLETIGFDNRNIGEPKKQLGIDENYKEKLTKEFIGFAQNKFNEMNTADISKASFGKIFEEFANKKQADDKLTLLINNEKAVAEALTNISFKKLEKYQKYGLTNDLLNQQQQEGKYQNLIDSFGEEWKRNKQNLIYKNIELETKRQIVELANEKKFFGKREDIDEVILEDRKEGDNINIDNYVDILENGNTAIDPGKTVLDQLNNKIKLIAPKDDNNQNTLKDFDSIDNNSKEKIIKEFEKYFEDGANKDKTFNDFLDDGSKLQDILQNRCTEKINDLKKTEEAKNNDKNDNKITALNSIDATNINFLNDDYLNQYLAQKTQEIQQQQEQQKQEDIKNEIEDKIKELLGNKDGNGNYQGGGFSDLINKINENLNYIGFDKNEEDPKRTAAKEALCLSEGNITDLQNKIITKIQDVVNKESNSNIPDHVDIGSLATILDSLKTKNKDDKLLNFLNDLTEKNENDYGEIITTKLANDRKNQLGVYFQDANELEKQVFGSEGLFKQEKNLALVDSFAIDRDREENKENEFNLLVSNKAKDILTAAMAINPAKPENIESYFKKTAKEDIIKDFDNREVLAQKIDFVKTVNDGTTYLAQDKETEAFNKQIKSFNQQISSLTTLENQKQINLGDAQQTIASGLGLATDEGGLKKLLKETLLENLKKEKTKEGDGNQNNFRSQAIDELITKLEPENIPAIQQNQENQQDDNPLQYLNKENFDDFLNSRSKKLEEEAKIQEENQKIEEEKNNLKEELKKLKKSLENLQTDFPDDEEIKTLEQELQDHEQEEIAKQQKDEEEKAGNQDELLQAFDANVAKLNESNKNSGIEIAQKEQQQNEEAIKNVTKEIGDLESKQSNINSKIDADTKNIAVYDVGESHTLNNIICAIGFIAGLAFGGPGIILAIGSLCFSKNDEEYISKEIPNYKDLESLKKLSENNKEIESKEKILKELGEKNIDLQEIVKGNQKIIKNIVVDAVKNLDSLINNCNSESQKTDLLGKIQNKIQEINPDAIKNSSLEEGQKQLILDNVKNLQSNPLDFEKLQNFVNEAKRGLGIDDQKQSPENDNGKNQNDKDKTEYTSTKENLESKITEAQNDRNKKQEIFKNNFNKLDKQHNDLQEKVKGLQDKNQEKCEISKLNEENKDIITKIKEELKNHIEENSKTLKNNSLPENRDKEENLRQ